MQRCLAIVETTTALGRGAVSRSDSDLQSSSRALVARCTGGSDLDEDVLIPEALALYIEASRRTVGASYSRDQLLAAAAMCVGVAPELASGSNRAAGLAAYWYSLRGRGVHVLLAGEYLARRDALSFMAVMGGGLDRRVALLAEGLSDSERRRCYLADVTVASYARFMDDFLRDHLPVTGHEPVQRDRYTAVVGDGSAIALGRATRRRAILAPIADLALLPNHASSDLDRVSARILNESGTDVQDGIVRLNARGIALLSEALGVPPFSAEFVVAGKAICSYLQSSPNGDDNAEIPYLEIALFAYLKKYDIVASTVWSASEDAPDLRRLYGLPAVRLGEEDAVVRRGLPIRFSNPAERLEALAHRVETARATGAPVAVRTMLKMDAELCVAALAALGIASARARPGDELDAFAQSNERNAVTVVEPDTTMPESLDADAVTQLAAVRLTGLAGPGVATADPWATGSSGMQHVAIGADTAASFVDWWRMALADGDEPLILVCGDDPLFRELDADVLESVRRLPGSFDGIDPDERRRAVGAELYDHAVTNVHYDRLAEWAYRSSVEKHAEWFYEWRAFAATAPLDDVVERLIDEHVADTAGQGPTDSEEIRRAVAIVEEIRRQTHPSTLVPLVRDTVLRGAGDTWCRFLSAASFLRLHIEDVYPPDGNGFVEYTRDLSSRFSEYVRDFRRTTLQSFVSG